MPKFVSGAVNTTRVRIHHCLAKPCPTRATTSPTHATTFDLEQIGAPLPSRAAHRCCAAAMAATCAAT
eukprot:11123495-Alexandrium_andersonii.AAC.1